MAPLRTRRTSSIHLLLFLVFSLLLSGLSAPGFSQTKIHVYDGYTGIINPYLHKDTVRITNVLPESPAERAGLKSRDQIITLNDFLIAGQGIGYRELMEILHDKSGTTLELQIKRKGEDSILNFSMERELYKRQIVAYEYEYLIDSLEQWDIETIHSGELDSLFTNPLTSKIRVHAVEEGSPAAKIGIMEGDQVVSLKDVMDKDYHYHLGSSILSSAVIDTSFTILRGDSLILFDLGPSIHTSFNGVTSQFTHDFSHSCAWLRIKLVNSITENRSYLINLPEMGGTDSANFYLEESSGILHEKRAGILIPVEDRDFVYKNWHVVTLPLLKDAEQTLYIRWKADSRIGAPLMHLIAEDSIVRHDRIERMVLFSLLGMMLIISIFFLMIFFAIRGRQYIYFAFYILFLACFLFVSAGYQGEYLWKASVFNSILSSQAQAFTLSLGTIFFLLFGIAYLELRKNLPGWFWSVVVLLGLVGARVLIMLLASVFGFELGEMFKDVVLIVWLFAVGFIPLFILLIPALLRIRSGFKPAWYFLLANLVLIPLAIISISSATFSYAEFTVHESILTRIMEVSGVYIAAVIQILIFAIGIAQKMKLDELENKRAQLRIIDQLKENEKLKDKVNRELEDKVRERTKEIREQKEEIESQRDEIEAQRDMVFDQKKEITDSIGYAQRIQAAVLPHTSYMDQVMPEYFVYYKPRDIVSGDFYWIKEVGNSVIIVVADCTGHGVPGAFMSMLGITLLNEQLGKDQLLAPAKILAQLREKVKEILVQEGHKEEQKDGMDMAIALIDREKKELQFAGAYNPLYLIRDKKKIKDGEAGLEFSMEAQGFSLSELKGDRQPIGIHWEETSFTNRHVSLEENDTLYVFTDGYVDQYGGDQRKKFKTRPFKELLLSMQTEPMERQKDLLGQNFENWRGNIKQIDDVCVIGVKIR